MKKVIRCDKKRFVNGEVVEVVRDIINEDRKYINMGSKGNHEGAVSVSNIVKNSSLDIGNIKKTHFLSKSYHQSLFYVNDVSSEVNNCF